MARKQNKFEILEIELTNTKIPQLDGEFALVDLPAREKDVLRLEVAVQDVPAVDEMYRRHDLDEAFDYEGLVFGCWFGFCFGF